MTKRLGLAFAAIIAAATPVAAQYEILGAEPSTTGYIFTRMGIAETLANADAEGRLTPGLATSWRTS